MKLPSRLVFAAIFVAPILAVILLLLTEKTKSPVDTTAIVKQEKNLSSVQAKKERFKSLLVPAIEQTYTELIKQYQEVKQLIEQDSSNPTLKALREQYKVADNQALLMAIKPHPKSIALAQAAMESSWGTSRFFKEANNVFGIWSFDPQEPRIAAFETRAGKTIWVKKYASVNESVSDYYRILARGTAFKDFRKLKMETEDPYLLVEKLDGYSEKGAEYGKELSSIIRFNKFYLYDT